MSDRHDSPTTPAAEGEVARWVRIEDGVRQDAARLARLASKDRQKATRRGCSPAASTRCEPTGSAPSADRATPSDD